MVDLEVEAGPTMTESRTEGRGQPINITKRMASDFGATLACRARITAEMERGACTRETARRKHRQENCSLSRQLLDEVLPEEAAT